LTGNSATGSVGSVQFFLVLAGNSATGAVGTLGATTGLALTGVSATGQVGYVGVYYWAKINTTQTPNWTNIHTV
jgi:hypothetical protein